MFQNTDPIISVPRHMFSFLLQYFLVIIDKNVTEQSYILRSVFLINLRTQLLGSSYGFKDTRQKISKPALGDCQAPSSVLLTLNGQSASRPKKKCPGQTCWHKIMFTLYIERIYLYV